MNQGFKLKNLGVIAHVDAGKTTLTERILYYARKIHKVGEVHDGSTQTDWMSQERDRGITIQLASVNFDWKVDDQGYKVNLIDTPGHVDLVVEVQRSMRVLDGAIIVLDGVQGVEPQTRKVYSQALTYNVPTICFANKMDRSGAEFSKCLNSLKENFNQDKNIFCPVVVSTVEDTGKNNVLYDLIRQVRLTYDGLDNFVEEPMEESDWSSRLNSYRMDMLNVLASHDDEILEDLLEERETSSEKLLSCLTETTRSRKVVPVLSGTALKNVGVQTLLNYSMLLFPTVNDRLEESPSTFKCLIFKVQELPKLGLVYYVKVYEGKVRKGDTLYNVKSKSRHRVNRIIRLHVTNAVEEQEVTVNDIVALIGVEGETGDTLSNNPNVEPLEAINVPKPVVSVAIRPEKDANSEYELMSKHLRLMTLQDPSLVHQVIDRGQVKEHILKGMGELHLQISLDILKTQYGLPVISGQPMVEYRSRLVREKTLQYTFKRQTGGSGLWARVFMKFKPVEDQEIEYSDTSVGGVVSKELSASVNDGVRIEAALGIDNYPPLQGFLANLHDGEMHPVDSKKKAFEMAGRYSLREAAKDNMVIVEPIMSLVVHTQEKFLGDVTADISRRRGVLDEVKYLPNSQVEITAAIPLACLFGYVNHLRSLTSGEGSAHYEFKMYSVVPTNVQESLLQ